MFRLLRSLAALALVVALGWFCVAVRVEGRTPYEHFRFSGGETAVLEGLDWVRSGLESSASALGSWVKDGIVEGWESGWLWVGQVGDALANEAKAWWAGDSDDPTDVEPRASSARESSIPPDSAAPDARALAQSRVDRLRDAAEPSGPAAHTKETTQVERRIHPEERRALNLKLAERKRSE